MTDPMTTAERLERLESMVKALLEHMGAVYGVLKTGLNREELFTMRKALREVPDFISSRGGHDFITLPESARMNEKAPDGYCDHSGIKLGQ